MIDSAEAARDRWTNTALIAEPSFRKWLTSAPTADTPSPKKSRRPHQSSRSHHRPSRPKQLPPGSRLPSSRWLQRRRGRSPAILHEGVHSGWAGRGGGVGLFGVVVVGGALLYFLVIARSGSSDELLSERPTPQLSPGQDSLKDLVPQQVGDFTLHSKLQEFTGPLQAGATQGVYMYYAHSEGREISHHLATFTSPEAANRYLRKDVDSVSSDLNFQKVEKIALKGEQGKRIGSAVLLRGEGFGKPAEDVVWTNGNLYVNAMALPGEHAVEFFNVPPPY